MWNEFCFWADFFVSWCLHEAFFENNLICLGQSHRYPSDCPIAGHSNPPTPKKVCWCVRAEVDGVVHIVRDSMVSALVLGEVALAAGMAMVFLR